MARNRIIFILIVGAASLMMVAVGSWFWFQEWQSQTTGLFGTETAIVARAADISVTATAVAELALTAEVVHAIETTISQTEQDVAATAVAISGKGDQAAKMTKDGLQIEILSLNRRAWGAIEAQNQFNDPPLPGRTMVMVKVLVTNVEGARNEYLGLSESDFRMIGEDETWYTTYGEETSCGVIPDSLDGVLQPGESMSGNVCFQVPQQEAKLQLVFYPYIGDDPSLYLDLSDVEK